MEKLESMLQFLQNQKSEFWSALFSRGVVISIILACLIGYIYLKCAWDVKIKKIIAISLAISLMISMGCVVIGEVAYDNYQEAKNGNIVFNPSKDSDEWIMNHLSVNYKDNIQSDLPTQ